MPSAKPKSPTRFTMKAFMAAALADGLSYQKPISRYEARPTPSQPKKSCTRLSAVTSISMKKVNRLRYAMKRGMLVVILPCSRWSRRGPSTTRR